MSFHAQSLHLCLGIAGISIIVIATAGCNDTNPTSTDDSSNRNAVAQEESAIGNYTDLPEKSAASVETSSESPVPADSQIGESSKEALPLGIVKEKPADGQSVETPQGFMVSYTETIPGTDVTFEMIPVPGGTFLMGSPEDEEDRGDDEGPRVSVEVPPFWIARCEITWAEFHEYVATYEPLKEIGVLREFLTYEPKDDAGKTSQEELAARVRPFAALFDHANRLTSETDAFTAPTPLYEPDFAYDLGEDPKQPAVTMTQYAAKQYTKWLSGLTGESYRLPAEVEWEYAARAGSETAFCFGDDPEELDDYAWYFDNSEDQMQFVGTKKPNAWGINDMHGNVAEFVLDQHIADHYAKFTDKTTPAAKMVAWPTEEFPRVIRGGSWADDPEWCRSAKRLRSSIDWSDPEGRDWKEQDPQIPKSPWWFTEPWTRYIGFRIMRPLTPMSEEARRLCWEVDAEDVQIAVEGKIEEGRGILGIADEKLTKAFEELKQYQEADEE